MACLGAAAGAAVLHAAREGVAREKFPSDYVIGVRELVLVGTGRGLSRKSITKRSWIFFLHLAFQI